MVEVVGNWSPAVTGNFSAHNSYGGGGGTYSTPIEGAATTLFRAGVQWDIGDPGYATANSFNGLNGSIGRVFLYTTPPTGLYASFDATPSGGRLDAVCATPPARSQTMKAAICRCASSCFAAATACSSRSQMTAT